MVSLSPIVARSRRRRRFLRECHNEKTSHPLLMLRQGKPVDLSTTEEEPHSRDWARNSGRWLVAVWSVSVVAGVSRVVGGVTCPARAWSGVGSQCVVREAAVGAAACEAVEREGERDWMAWVSF
ncbi:uncharacterized protein A4U43_C07F14150 [Asparagus officinalis]|uniref:Uncharacterized protein n=1 Tax=Asparagus officinalis TaxID=4686 RepID=A0A5P1EF70_ASPOF|nr:uncharacterized protein A4U43_C07F14150 [Asparagus officinalis]